MTNNTFNTSFDISVEYFINIISIRDLLHKRYEKSSYSKDALQYELTKFVCQNGEGSYTTEINFYEIEFTALIRSVSQ